MLIIKAKFANMDNKKMESISNAHGWIQTYSGNKFHILKPVISELSIKDIAHSQSLLCRFCGHSPFFFSVGSHALIGSYLIEKTQSGSNVRQYALDFLMHDSTESFIGDMVTPLKREMKRFQEVEEKLFKIIAKKYNLSYPMPKEVKEMDKFMFETEWAYLMTHSYNKQKSQGRNSLISKKDFLEIASLPPKTIEKLFLKRFKELS